MTEAALEHRSWRSLISAFLISSLMIFGGSGVEKSPRTPSTLKVKHAMTPRTHVLGTTTGQSHR